jgi:hypothetical protein
LSSTEITTGKFLQKKTKAWLVVEAQDNNCYVQGVLPTDGPFTKEISSESLGSPESYTIFLLAADDETVNKDLGFSSPNTPISCGRGDSSIHTIAQATVSSLQPFNLATRFGGAYGGITVNRDTNNQKITLNGTFSSAAGYAIEKDPALSSLGGRALTLRVEGTTNSSFDEGKLFKLAVNGEAVEPTDASRRSSNDPDYITVQEGSVSFQQLPDEVDKIELVFWNASLNNLEISLD